MKDWIKAHLVPEAREWWRLWSMRLNAIGLAILAYVQFDPIGALSVFNMMPAAVRAALPEHFLTVLALFFFGLAMLARVVKQPALEKNDVQ
jgi:hypothetical protein